MNTNYTYTYKTQAFERKPTRKKRTVIVGVAEILKGTVVNDFFKVFNSPVS